jgi:hypothetical protein
VKSLICCEIGFVKSGGQRRENIAYRGAEAPAASENGAAKLCCENEGNDIVDVVAEKNRKRIIAQHRTAVSGPPPPSEAQSTVARKVI